MRVLQIVRQYSPGVGGLETFVAQLARHLVPLGIQSDILTLDRLFLNPGQRLPAEEMLDGHRVFRIPYFGSSRYPIAPRVLSFVKDYDVIHVHGVDFFVDFLANTRAFHRKPLLLSTHGGFFHTRFAQRLKRFYFRTVTRWTLEGVDRVVACSVPDLESFRTISNRVDLIENAVDVERFQNIERQVEPGMMLYLGRISSNKRIDRLLKMLAQLKTHSPSARLVVAGPDWDNLAPSLITLAAELGVSDNLTFKGKVTDAELNDLLSRAQLFVSASEYEGFGLTAVEAMAAGILPALQPIPPFESLLQNVFSEALVDYSDASTAAEKIHCLLTMDPLRYDGLSKQARERATQFAWPQAAAKFKRVYEAATGQQTRRLFGVNFSPLSTQAVSERFAEAVQSRLPMTVSIANAHTLNLARRDDDYRSVLNRSLVLNDGAGVSIASRILYGKPFPENLNGTDLIPKLLALAPMPLRIYLLGGKPGVAEEAGAHLKRLFPGHEIIGTSDGYFPVSAEHHILDKINMARPDILLVAMGNPRQEKWLAQHAESLEVPVRIGVGALFDFLAQRVPRAPRWMRALHLEWVFRLLLEPRRLWKRYILGNADFLLGLATPSARYLPDEVKVQTTSTSYDGDKVMVP